MKKDHVIAQVENAYPENNPVQRNKTREFMLETADCLIIHIQLHDSEG